MRKKREKKKKSRWIVSKPAYVLTAVLKEACPRQRTYPLGIDATRTSRGIRVGKTESRRTTDTVIKAPPPLTTRIRSIARGDRHRVSFSVDHPYLHNTRHHPNTATSSNSSAPSGLIEYSHGTTCHAHASVKGNEQRHLRARVVPYSTSKPPHPRGTCRKDGQD